jgi:hypothetical protein
MGNRFAHGITKFYQSRLIIVTSKDNEKWEVDVRSYQIMKGLFLIEMFRIAGKAI